MKMKDNSNILDKLYIIIVLNIIPSALYGLIKIPSGLYTALYAAVYFIQTLIIIFAIIRDKSIKVRKKHILLSALLIAIAISIVVYNIVVWGDIASSEYISLIANAINIVVLISISSQATIYKKNLATFYRRIIILGIISAIINVALNYNKIFNLAALTNSYSANFSSFFPNRNQYGMFILACIVSLVNLEILTKMPKKRFIFCMILFIAMLILSMSRNSILGLLIFAGIYLIISENKVTKNRLLAAVIIFVVSIFSIFGMIQNERLYDTVNTMFLRTETIGSASGRSEVWQNGISIGSKYNPITGVGRERSIELNNVEFNNSLEHFHSTYIQTYAMYGVLGLILLIGALINIISKIKKLPVKSRFRASLLAMMFAFVVMSIFETMTRFSIGYADTMGMIFYFTIPLLIISNKSSFLENDTSKSTIAAT